MEPNLVKTATQSGEPKTFTADGVYRNCYVTVTSDLYRISIEIKPQANNSSGEMQFTKLLTEAVSNVDLPEVHVSISDLNMETTSCSMDILTQLNALNKKGEIKVIWSSSNKKSHYILGHQYSEMFEVPMIVRHF